MQHIIDARKNEFAKSEQDVIDFLNDVFNGATVLRRARGGAMFVVVENTETDQVAIIKLRPSNNGDYYNVESAGYYRKDKRKYAV
jgi:hypothetical protein